MAAVTEEGGAVTGPTGPQVDAAYARMTALATDLRTAAVVVVRAWLIGQGRAFIGVDIARTVVAPAAAADDTALNLAARYLPAEAYSAGLDIRGHFTVRLSTLNEHLGRDSDDREPVAPPGGAEPRIEAVVDRYPDGGTDVQLFADGKPVSFEEYVIDPGWGYEWEDWADSRAADIASASPAVAEVLWGYVLSASESKYIENAPDSPDKRVRDLQKHLQRHATSSR